MRAATFRYLSILASLALSSGTRALEVIGPKADMPIVNADISPDGYTRAAVLAGGTFPGPLVKGNKGDNFQINVQNKLTNATMFTPTTIHWHGIFQRHTNWADGGAFVNQCPIIPGNSFLYNFHAPDQAGTFWYHSHVSTQYCDGLRGPMVVYDPHDPHKHLYDVDDENTIITLADWYHAASVTVRGAAFQDATLINGLGRWSQQPTSELAVIKVTHGKRYRFRLISISCDPNHTFSIDNHTMTIIETDSENTQPHLTDQIQLFAGQRYSVVVHANQTIGNYWIRAAPNEAANDAIGFGGGINMAILRYDGAEEEEPTTPLVPPSFPMREWDLHPLTDPAAPGSPNEGGADVPITLNIGFNGTMFNINGAPFTSPSIPVLLQIMSGAHNAQDLLPSGGVYTLPRNKTVEVTIPPFVLGGPHPFHLHGHSFSVVRSAGQKEANYVDPVRRDVVSIGNNPTDNVTFRFRTDNPGPWFLHCHIDFHLNTGLAVVFAEDTENIVASNPVPKAWSELCPDYYSQFSDPIVSH